MKAMAMPNAPAPTYWVITYKKTSVTNTADYQCCGTVQSLMRLIDNPKTVMIWRANFPDNSAMAETADFLPGANNLSNVAFDDTAHPNLPTKNLDGSIGPLRQMSFGAMLWHEVIGHGGLWAKSLSD